MDSSHGNSDDTLYRNNHTAVAGTLYFQESTLLTLKVTTRDTNFSSFRQVQFIRLEVQQMVIDEMISTGHARCLISIEDPELQHQLALRIFDEKLSVRETEKLVRKLLQENNAPQKKINDPVLSAIYADLADQMKRIFGTKVEIHQRNDQKGKIEIEYYSQDELNRLIELIQSIQQQ